MSSTALSIHFTPNLVHSTQAHPFIKHAIGKHVTGDVINVGTISDLHTLLAGTRELEKIQSLLFDDTSLVANDDILNRTRKHVLQSIAKHDLAIGILSPTCEFHDTLIMAKLLHSGQMKHYKTAFMTSKPWSEKTKVQSELRTWEALNPFFGRKTPQAQSAYFLLLLKPDASFRIIHTHTSSLVDQIWHELTHYTDSSLFDAWIEANHCRVQNNLQPDSLFEKFTVMHNGVCYLSRQFSHIVSEARAFHVSALLMVHKAEKNGASTFDIANIWEQMSQMGYRGLVSTGCKSHLDELGITPENFISQAHVLSALMIATIDETVNHEKK